MTGRRCRDVRQSFQAPHAGVLRVWLDGQQVLEKTDIRFRHNPAIKIDEIWLNWYHGGTQPAAAEHHYRMSNVVVARSYIGPMGR